ncbi:hypothetical protein ACCC86_22405, partial [Kosakonia cowanii]
MITPLICRKANILMTCCPTLSSDGDGVGGSGQAQGAAMSAVTIHLRGEDRTAQIHDWKIYWSDKHQAWFLTLSLI